VFRKPRRLFSIAALVCLTILSFFLFKQSVADKSGFSLIYVEDYNGDGRVTISDAVAFLLLSRDNPSDPRLDYNGDGHYGITDAVALIINIARDSIHENTTAVNWRGIGPGGGGAMFIPTIDPHDPAHVLVASDMTGAFVTTDGGASWRNFNLRTVVNDYEFDPSSPGTVYAGNNGLFRSGDGGKRWKLIYPDPANVIAEHMAGDHAEQWFETVDGMPDNQIVKIRVDPSNSSHIWIGLSQLWWEEPSKLLVSHDRGATWQVVIQSFSGKVMAIFPGTWWGKPDEVIVITDKTCLRFSEITGKYTIFLLPDMPLIAVDGGSGSEGSVFYALSSMRQESGMVVGGLYRSTDLGATWKSLRTNLWNGAGVVPSYITLASCRSKPEVVYISCGSYGDGSNYGIFKSADKGETWKWSYQADWSKVLSKNYSESWMHRSYGPSWSGSPVGLGVCPTNSDVCYATDYGTAYHTVNGGTTWEQVYSNNQADNSYATRGLDVTTCYGVHFDPLDSLHLFITYTDIGLFHSYNGGKSWLHSISGVPGDWINTCYWLVFDPTVKNLVWSVWADCHDLPRPKMFTSGKLAQGGYLGGVAVSDNGGRTWRASNAYMPMNTVCTHILLDPTSTVGSRTLYVCGFSSGVYKSTDGGKSWSQASNGIGSNRNAWRMVRLPDGTLYLLVARGLENNNVIDGVLYRSDDAAANWKVVALPQGVNAPNDLIYDPSDPKRMYLSSWPTEDRSVQPRIERHGGLYRTEDGGTTWKLVFREDTHVYAAAVDPENPSTVIINTFDSAAFRSDDRGETWYRLRGYNFKWGHRPVFDPHHPGMLYLTTFGGSVFYGPAAGVPSAFEDIENLNESWRWHE